MLDLRNCDNMELMAEFGDNHFELAICDPPYGYGDEKTDILNFRQKEQHREWNTAPTDEYFNELFRVSKDQIIWGGNYFHYIWRFGGRGFIYWHKGNPVENFADGELAWTSFDRNAKQIDLRYYGNLEDHGQAPAKVHPTQKPVKLYKWLLKNYAKEGDKILDTHGGSMSIAIACHYMGFDLTLCELDKDYYEAGIKRVKQETSQISLF